MKKRFTEEQIIGFLREAEAGLPIKELCRKHAFSEASYYLWKAKFGSMSVPDAKLLKELDAENARLKKRSAQNTWPINQVTFHLVSGPSVKHRLSWGRLEMSSEFASLTFGPLTKIVGNNLANWLNLIAQYHYLTEEASTNGPPAHHPTAQNLL